MDAVKTKEDAKQDETAAKEEETLIEVTQKRLDILNGVTSSDEEDDDTDDDKQAEDDKGDDDSTPDEDDEKDDDKQAEEDDDDDDSTPEKDKDETEGKDGSKNKSDDEEVTLKDAYYRAAIHQGWEPEDIKEFFEANPELAVKTFAKIHSSTNKLSSEFARLGRVKPAKGQQKADDKVTVEDSDLAALKEQYGDDSPVVKVFQKLQTRLDDAIVVKAEEPEQVQEDMDPIVLGRIEKFWVDPGMKPYAEFYGEGKDEAKLTRGQSDNRYKVLETADSIAAGYYAQGRQITLEKAMEKAHLLVSESVRESAIRKELTTKIKKRAKGVTLKPSKSKKAPEPKDKKLDEKGLIEVTAMRLQKAFKT